MSKEVNYKWIPKKGWVVESEDETLKEVGRTINFQEYLNQNKDE